MRRNERGQQDREWMGNGDADLEGMVLVKADGWNDPRGPQQIGLPSLRERCHVMSYRP